MTLSNESLSDPSITFPAVLPVEPLTHSPDVTLEIPGSKSITNRALILAALASGTSRLYGALEADDTRVMVKSLRALGIPVVWETGVSPATGEDEDLPSGGKERVIYVEGQGGRLPATRADLFVGNSGTSIRFLSALCALGKGVYTLDGVPRMRERPQADLLDALQTLGVHAASVAQDGCPPLRIETMNGLQGGTVRLRAEASSQYLTALLMAAPYAAGDVRIEILGPLRPFYVEITRQMMAQWGVQVENEGADLFHIPCGQRYAAQTAYQIEPDASSASYFFAAAAVTGGRVTVRGLSSHALQGDARFATEVLAAMGCTVQEVNDTLTVIGPPNGKLHGIERDMSAISDTSLTLAAIAPFADSPTTVRNIAHSRRQECDRVSAVCAELTRMGVKVEEHADGYTIYPAETIHPALVQTYHDHRVAMSFALVGLKAPGVTIEDPGCVAKTFPGFWQTLEQLRR